MKKRILFIVMLFVALTGSYKEKTRAASNNEMTRQVVLEPVNIQSKSPTSGEVKGNLGATVFFSIRYSGTSPIAYSVYKGRKEQKESERFIVSKDEETKAVAVVIHNARFEDSGTYYIKISNNDGNYKDEADFNVAITD